MFEMLRIGLEICYNAQGYKLQKRCENMKEGILPLWKEKGMTSFGCVREVRRILGIKKVGHAGTLDPEVDGVLPLAIGSATKVLEYMLESDKTYAGEITLGYSTSTEDASGETIKRKAVLEPLSEEEIDRMLESFTGTIEQTPPMFSAVKVGGRRLYEYAFEGKEVERPSRQVTIYNLKRTNKPKLDREKQTLSFQFDVSCSKGTYIRTLAVDIGKMLGYPAHMSKLTRVRSGVITKEQTSTLEEIRQAVEENRMDELLLPIDYALNDFPKYAINEELWKKVKHGALLDEKDFNITEYPVLFTYNNQAVALYERHQSKIGKLIPKKMFKTEV